MTLTANTEIHVTDCKTGETFASTLGESFPDGDWTDIAGQLASGEAVLVGGGAAPLYLVRAPKGE